MNHNARFWVLMAAFQVFFGFAVFAITRDYYAVDVRQETAHPSTIAQSVPAWPNSISEAEIDRLSLPRLGDLSSQDPLEIYKQANEFFANRQYDRAAQYYERLLDFSPNDAEVHNNLGITLHYLGRSNEALERLNKGIAVDPNHQRSWLTLGYVNSQLGNTEQARSALTNATQIGNSESIKQSALQMLEALP